MNKAQLLTNQNQWLELSAL